MKDIRFNISLYIIIPLIFAGIAVMSIIVVYNVTTLSLGQGINPERMVLIFGIVMMAVTFVLGLLIAKLLLGPVERFVHKTEQLGVLKNVPAKGDNPAVQKDDMGRFNLVFDQVTELLSQVEAEKFFPQIVGNSKAMRGVFNQIMKVADTDSTVLILGETGTGKELISKSIHEHSHRTGKPFVAINCAAIPSGLLESELFGHEKGAFTSAESRKLGKFEIANGGTIFMDEIGDMPLDTQAKVLRVIQESQFERVGGVRSIKVNVRFIAATNKDLSKMVDKGVFRQDLFFRLNVFNIHLPPLRERKEDIPALVEEFLVRHGSKSEISSEALQMLAAYSWPGNVRELQNAVESASVLGKEFIKPQHLPTTLTRNWREGNEAGDDLSGTFASLEQKGTLDEKLRELEKGMIIEALTRSDGVQVKAAQRLGIKERSLWHRIKKLEIDVSSFKH
jgi:transcriptional regulator with GAF, ATPase, and Fis domain